MATKPKKAVASARKKNPGGRPELPPEERRGTLVRVLVTAEEHEELKLGAALDQRTLSTWLRLVGLERARALAAEKEAKRKRDE
ncbi:MAG TPA: hypothetical protein VGG74_21770 [Kofleriaceae bacterium]|jgi:hypothetical protein